MSRTVAIDLFAGAGGLSIGARRAGVDVRVAVELDPIACSTLAANQAHANMTILKADITTLSGQALRGLAQLGRGDRLIVIGGPPCQPFSKAAYWLDDGQEARYRQARTRGEIRTKPTRQTVARPDPRRGLVGEVWRVAVEADADAFVLENVPSLLHPRNRHEIEAVIDGAEGAGYQTSLVRANAAEFGVPQRRVRVFLLGVRGQVPVPPRPTHSVRETNSLGRLPAVTAAEAIARFAGDEFAEDGELVEGRWASHFRTIPPGWNYRFHTAWADHPDPRSSPRHGSGTSRPSSIPTCLPGRSPRTPDPGRDRSTGTAGGYERSSWQRCRTFRMTMSFPVTDGIGSGRSAMQCRRNSRP